MSILLAPLRHDNIRPGVAEAAICLWTGSQSGNRWSVVCEGLASVPLPLDSVPGLDLWLSLCFHSAGRLKRKRQHHLAKLQQAILTFLCGGM